MGVSALRNLTALAAGTAGATQSEDAEAGFFETGLSALRKQFDETMNPVKRTLDDERAVTRGQRETAPGTPVLSAEEKAAIRASVDGTPGTLKAAMDEARRIKRQFPSSNVQTPWAPVKITGMEVAEKNGKVSYSPSLSKHAYSYHIDPSTGKEAQRGSQHFESMADNLAAEVVDAYKRAQDGDPVAQKIMSNQGWYRNVESRGFNEYGSFYDTFGDLLGATSPNTPVATNFKFSKDVLARASRGDFDEAIDQFADIMERVDGLEVQRDAMLTAAKSDPNTTMKAVKDSESFKAINSQIKSAKAEIDPIRQESGKLYGINSTNAMIALADRWRTFRKGSAPKAKNFSGNLVGYSVRPTIDVWSARNLRRHAGLPPIPSAAENGVTGKITDPDTMTSNLEFGFGQDVVEEATKRVNDQLGVDLEPRDMQALQWFIEKDVWSRNGWTNAAGEGGSFETMMDLDPTESLVVGTSRTQDAQFQGKTFNPGPQDQLEVARKFMAEANADPDVIAGKSPTTLGLYGDEAETSFDIDIVSKRDQVPGDTLDLVAEQAVADAQDSFFVARRVEPQLGKAFPEQFQVGMEAYFDAPVDAGGEQIKTLQKFLEDRGVQGFTLIVDPRNKPGAMAGKVAGVRFVDIPQFYDPDGFAKMSPEAYKEHVNTVYNQYNEIGNELRESFGQIRSAEPSFFDVNVKRRGDTENYLAQRKGVKAGDAESLQQEFWGFKPATERFREFANPNTGTRTSSGGTAAPAVFGAALAGLATQADAMPTEVSTELDNRVSRRVRGKRFQARSRQREQRYADIKKNLLENFVEPAGRNLMELGGDVMEDFDMPFRSAVSGIRAIATGVQGGDPVRAIAQTMTQDSDETMRQFGGYVTDQAAAAGVNPDAAAAMGTAAYALPQVLSPL